MIVLINFNMSSFVGNLFRLPILRLAAVLLAAFAWSSPSLCSPISEAIQQGDLAKVTEILNQNPHLVSSKDEQGDTPLHLAAWLGQKDVAELLLDRHAEINAKDNNGDTPLHLAARMGQSDVAELLLARKADVNPRDSAGY